MGLTLDISFVLDAAAVSLTVIILAYASISDIREREVSNRVWVVYGPLAIALTSFRIILFPSLFMIAIFSIILLSLFSLTIFYLGLFGGADAKALICISLANPVFPQTISSFFPSFHPFLTLAVFYNSYLFSLVMAFHAIIKNVLWKLQGKPLFKAFEKEKRTTRILMILSGYKTSLRDLENNVALYPLEQPDEMGLGRRIRLFTSAENERHRLIENLKIIQANEVDGVWVSWGLPMIVFFFSAYLILVFLGDPMVSIIRLFIK